MEIQMRELHSELGRIITKLRKFSQDNVVSLDMIDYQHVHNAISYTARAMDELERTTPMLNSVTK